MVPGWRLLTFRALDFAASDDFSADNLRNDPRYPGWLAIAGTDWHGRQLVRLALPYQAAESGIEPAILRV